MLETDFCKLNPSRSMYLGGFARAGASASLNSVTDNSFQVSGIFSDVADFATLYIFDADDNFGHLQTSKYLPNFSLENVTLSFDLSTSGCFNPTSPAFESVPWKSISYITANGDQNTLPFPTPTVNSGGAAASVRYTLSGTPTTYDRIIIVYLSNIIFDSASFGITTGQTLAQVATAMVGLVNAYSYGVEVPLSAVVDPNDPNSFIISYSKIGLDGDNIALITMLKSGSVISITNQGQIFMTGGTAPDSINITFNFSTLGIANVRQVWFTIAPTLPPASGYFAQREFNWTVTNWTVTDPNNVLPLKIAGPNSTTIASLNPTNVTYTGTWGIQSGFFYGGFAKVATSNAATVTIIYTNNFEHDLYLGTSLYSDRGTFNVTLDGVSQGSIDMNLGVTSLLNTRRLLVENVTAGSHTLLLTTTSSSPCYFDYLQAVVSSEPIEPLETYGNLSAAFDFDTPQTYQLAPNRSLYIYRQLGLRGNIDVYSGVFFKEVRQRNGGLFNSAYITFNGTWNTGTGFGNGAQLFITLSGTSFGVSVYPSDTNITIAQRFSDFIAGFVGVRGIVSGNTTTAELTITQLTPLNYFSISISTSATPGGTMQLNSVTAPTSSTIKGGNEGTWEISSTNVNGLSSFPLNKGFMDWVTSFKSEADRYGLEVTLSFSQELLQPPDVNTTLGAWTQRYSDGTPVLTDTGFGSWGIGYVIGYSVTSGVTTIYSPGYGAITGNTVSIYNVTTPYSPTPTTLIGSYIITAIDANNFSFIGSPTLSGGDQFFFNLLTSQCTFNPNTVTPYIAAQYVQVSGIVNTLQFGEVGWWFSAGGSGPSMAYYDAYTTSQATTILGRSLATFSGPTSSPAVNGYADADFLVSLLVAHIHTIRTAVLKNEPNNGMLFEWLCPYDVNWPTAYQNVQYPYNIGGALNNYVNIPKIYLAPGNDIDRILVEALAWGTSYRSLDNAETSINFPSVEGEWPLSLTSYLIPVQNGGCPWVQELNLAISAGISAMKLWAIDHIILLSWPFPIQWVPQIEENFKYLIPPQTTTITYYRNFINDLILTPSPNNGGAIGGEQ